MLHTKEMIVKDVVFDVTCDVCNMSTAKDGSVETDDLSLEFALLSADWGYFSGKDGKQYSIHLCEKCFDKVMTFLESEGGHKILPAKDVFALPSVKDLSDEIAFEDGLDD